MDCSSHFIDATGQRWKLVASLAVVSLCALTIFVRSAILSLLGEELAIVLVMLATLASLASFVAPCVLVRCPRCRCKLLWRAVSTQAASLWLLWLLELTGCPECHYDPGGSRAAV